MLEQITGTSIFLLFVPALKFIFSIDADERRLASVTPHDVCLTIHDVSESA
jgi:hypothetical protein